jgi:ribose transport system ATP-binding protein
MDSFESSVSESTALLEMKQIGKRFGATQALKDVSLAAHAGETLALIGENGAGKSTLMKILSGAHDPDEGSMSLDGLSYRPRGPYDARQSGVAMIYQELNLAKDLSVEDNIMLGQEHHRVGLVDRKAQRQKVRNVLSLLGHPDLSPSRLVSSLSIGAQQLVEIARALVSDARVMIFDEPTSSLPKDDVDRLFAIIERLRKQGMAVIYISHFLEEIRQVAQRFVVLRDGQPAGSGMLQGTSDSQIIAMMAGRSVETLFPQVPHSIGEPMLHVRSLTGIDIPSDVSFELRRGEILGLFGLVGAGRTETLRRIFGLDAITTGQIELNGRTLHDRPRASILAGMGLVSEDRKAEGLAQALSISDNLTLSDLSPYSRFGVLNLSKMRSSVAHWMNQLSVKARSPDQPVTHLSGGNQQKVAIARVLHQNAELLLLDEPTRGIDVGTKSEIYRLIGQLAAEGKAIIFASSYLPELMAICDTIGVMSRGRLRDLRPAAKWDEHEILSAAIT